jgi:uncharacterized membrane protein YgaE (UPF0421/DUF939 family)
VNLAARLARLRRNGLVIAQASVAAGLAWLAATEVLGHQRPFFAPVSAILTVGLTYGQRRRRAAEIVIGVAVGILVGDALVLGIGTGAWQLTLVIALAMAAALLLGTGPLLATQASVSAALVVTLQPPGSGLEAERFVDALVGGGFALAISSLVLPTTPLTLVRDAARPVLDELAAVLEDIADALERRDLDAAGRALARARDMSEEEERFLEAVEAGRETAATAPHSRGRREELELYATAAGQLDLAIRNVRVLARGVRRAIELEDNAPPAVPAAMRDLAQALDDLAVELERGDAADDVRAAVLRAAARATGTLEQTSNLSVSAIIGQIRFTATDILRGLGDSPADAREAVRAAAE